MKRVNGLATATLCVALCALSDPTAKAEDVKVRLTLKEQVLGVGSVAFTPDGKSLISTGTKDDDSQFLGIGEVVVWDAGTGKEAARMAWAENLVGSIAITGDGKTGAIGYTPIGAIDLWNVTTRKRIGSLDEPKTDRAKNLRSLAFSTDGKTLAAGVGETVPLWTVATGKIRATIVAGGAVTSVAWSKDGKNLAVANGENGVTVWDPANAKKRLTLEGHTKGVRVVAFSPDGKTLASGGKDYSIKLWNVATGKEQASLDGHEGQIRALAFSADGKTLASGGLDGTVRLWSTATSKELAVTEKVKGGIWSLAFSPDGKTLASGGPDKVIRIWNVEPITKPKK